jgi:Low psii accumulation1 / Rep27
MITASALIAIVLCTSSTKYSSAYIFPHHLSSLANARASIDDARKIYTSARELDDSAENTQPASATPDVETAKVDLQEGLRVKLKEEISSPFRKVRQFIYSGAGIAGLIGTVTAVPQLIFAVQDGGEAITGAITNVAIDVGAVVLAVVGWNKDAEGERIKLERYTRKEKILSFQMSSTDIEDREKDISLLPVQIQVSEKDENATRIVSLGELQSKGKQNIIIVAGKRDFVKDVVISAKIEGAELFNSKEIYVVPVVLEDDQLDAALAKGFGAPKESLMSAPYIGKPMQVSIKAN